VATLLTSPAPLASAQDAKPNSSATEEGFLPTGADGKPLNFDFETGTLKDWRAEGEAFAGQPIAGDKVNARRADMHSRHQGKFWIGTHEVRRGERPIELTQREFELLEYLMRNERLVISRQKLLDEVWGYDPFSITNTIEVFVSNLRRKLEAGGEPRLLHTVRGAGYVLRV